jgi:hypothetical protein
VVFDTLGEWLIGQLADADRQRLTKPVLGSELKRALEQAVAGAAGDDAGGEGDVQGAEGGQHERQERPWTPKPKR